MLEAAMFYTPAEFTTNSPGSPMTPTQVKKPSDRKSMCLSTTILDVKKETVISQVKAAKYKRNAITSGTIPAALKPKQKVNSKINDQINKSI